MLIYWLIFAFLSMLSVLSLLRTNPVTVRRLYIVIGAMLVVFSGLRGDFVGFDYDQYDMLFNHPGRLASHLFEPIYQLLFRAFIPLGNLHYLLCFIAIPAITIKLWFFKRYSFYPFLSLVIYYVTLFLIADMGQIRYGLGMAVILIYFYLLVTRPRLYLLLPVLLTALMCHYSTIIVWPTLLFYRRRFSLLAMALLTTFGAAFYFIDVNAIILLASDYMPQGHIQTKMIAYALDTKGFGHELGVNFSLVMRFAILLALYHMVRKAPARDPWHIFFNLYFYGVVLYMVFNANSEFAIRTSGYFKILEVVILPLFVKMTRDQGWRLVLMTIIIIYSAYSLWKIVVDPDVCDPFIPYSNILFS
ncbi:EpsG family protein [uncultured Duncaniella sp.]|uniref:EpsG family protein n=1 Tax=uncultured Duncaniella sp. TaxID=2768039 RepID=UPI002674B5C3|nr:EpsG family protein [uncultured Duncaniella sp.]MCI9171651.1 EpsG family protein [Muribaculaceae bacterium]